MNARGSKFNRVFLIVLVVLYLLTIAAISYASWVTDPEFMRWGVLLINAVILSIPLILLFGSIYVLVIAWRERATLGQVSPGLVNIIHWAPRLAAILIIIFTGLFSLDVFEMDASPLELLGGFLMHNIPSIAMLVLLIFAWRRPAVGFFAFIAAAALFAILFTRGSSPFSLLLFVIPLLLVAFLFYADWKWLVPQISKPAEPSV